MGELHELLSKIAKLVDEAERDLERGAHKTSPERPPHQMARR